MRDKLKRAVRPGDLIAVAALLLAALLLGALFGGKDGVTAEIIVGRRTLYTIDLTAVEEPYTVSPEDGVTVLVEPGAIRFLDSDCPNRLCVRAGRLTKAGQSAACIPRRTLICVKGRAKNAPDAITG